MYTHPVHDLNLMESKNGQNIRFPGNKTAADIVDADGLRT